MVSRLGLHNRIIDRLRRYRITHIEDYFKHRKQWRNANDIIEIARKTNSDSVIIVLNWRLALELLARGVKRVIVITPVLHSLTEILSCKITIIEGDIKAIEETI